MAALPSSALMRCFCASSSGSLSELAELFVHHGIDTADEEAGDGTDAVHRLTRGGAAFQAANVSLGNLLIHFDREDQGHVDVQPGSDELLDGRKSGGRARNLDHHIRAIQPREQFPGFFDGRLGVIGEQRRNFQADEAVAAIAGVVNLAKGVGSAGNVLDDDFLVNVRYAASGTRQLSQLLSVVLAAADGLLEDRRVRSEAAESIIA